MIYVFILTGGNMSSTQLANMDLIYQSVRSFSRRGEDKVKRVDRFQPAASIPLSKYMKICCNIQVVINRLRGNLAKYLPISVSTQFFAHNIFAQGLVFIVPKILYLKIFRYQVQTYTIKACTNRQTDKTMCRLDMSWNFH